MKGQAGFLLFTAAAMLLLPAAALTTSPPEPLTSAADADPVPPLTAPSSDVRDPSPAPATTASYRMLDCSTGQVVELPLRTYLVGVVCAEMPATFESEALKAQTVAAHTYAERMRLRQQTNPDPTLLGADFSNDSSLYQAYYTESQMRNAYGDAYETYIAKITAAVDAVASELLYYQQEPIVAAFHAMSAGKTENAEIVWGQPLAYLVSVDSATDAAAPRYQETIQLSPDAVRQALQTAAPDVTFPDDLSAWFAVQSVSDAGTVLSMQGGSRLWSGQQLRELLNLRSACFSVSVSNGAFSFTTKGHGHAVGMSQYGANAMAAAGHSYAEILAHYYPGTALVSNG